MTRPAPLAVIAGLAILAGCAGSAPEGDPGGDGLRPTRGYVLISLDTLRADHLGLYGYERDTSPFLDELGRRAVVFERASVQYPTTLTSHMSILTGLYPAEHGVYPPADVLSSEIETLPEAFQRSGFTTAGFTEGGYMDGSFGFSRGFDVFEADGVRRADLVERTFERGLRFLQGLGRDERFLLFLHTYAAHTPYAAPKAYKELYWPGGPPTGAFPPTGPEMHHRNVRGEQLTQEVLDYLVALYDAEIRRLDDVLRRFFAELEASGLAGEITVVITSDHGEEFQEHGSLDHRQLYDEALHVPLLVLHPDAAPRRVTPPVESVDLAPTLFDIARVEPRQAPSGRSLVPDLAGEAPPESPESYAEIDSGPWSLYSQKSGRLFHLLAYEPSPELWFTRRLRLSVGEGPVDFEIRSYREPRRLEIRAGDEVLRTFEAPPEWTRVHLEPTDHRRVLSIESPDCTMVEGEGHLRCYSFQVRGIPLEHAQLYDLLADPDEARDLALAEPGLVRALYQRLADYRRRHGAESRSGELDEELREQLKALGYLQ